MKTRPDLFFKTGHDRPKGETDQQAADRIQIELVELVDEFCTFSPTHNPITFINNMLNRWLTLPTTSLVEDGYDLATLNMGQNLIDFFTALNVHLKDLRHFQEQAEKEGKEVGHE